MKEDLNFIQKFRHSIGYHGISYTTYGCLALVFSIWTYGSTQGHIGEGTGMGGLLYLMAILVLIGIINFLNFIFVLIGIKKALSKNYQYIETYKIHDIGCILCIIGYIIFFFITLLGK